MSKYLYCTLSILILCHTWDSPGPGAGEVWGAAGAVSAGEIQQ